jgi:hypothetical protein
MSDGLSIGCGAKIPRGGVRGKEMKILTPFKLPARVPVWIAGVSICLLAASGVVAIVRSIPAHASIPTKDRVGQKVPADTGYSEDSQGSLPGLLATTNRRNRALCLECGVVESIRQIERSSDVGRLRTKAVGRVFGGASLSTVASNAEAERVYEFTVRFRDGSTTTFNEADPRSWPLGSRVILIGGSTASTASTN